MAMIRDSQDHGDDQRVVMTMAMIRDSQDHGDDQRFSGPWACTAAPR
jgi:hypothetical protein